MSRLLDFGCSRDLRRGETGSIVGPKLLRLDGAACMGARATEYSTQGRAKANGFHSSAGIDKADPRDHSLNDP